MPSRLLSKSDIEISKALTAAKLKNDTITEGNEVLSTTTTSNLDIEEPDFAAILLARSIALRNQGTSTAALDEKRERAKLLISHFFQAFNNGVVRGVFPEQDRAFYKLNMTSGNLPNLSSDANILEWGNNIQVGDPARTADGGVVMANPSLADFNVAFIAYKTAKGTHTALKDAYEASQVAVANKRATELDLILRIWNEVETYYSAYEPSTKRRMCKEWGVIYVNSATDNSLEGTVTDTNNMPVAGAVISIEQLSVSANSNSNGEYSIATITAGTYTLKVTKTGFQEKNIPNITIESGATSNIDVQLISTTGSLHAIITCSAQPLAGATIAIESLALTVSSAADGTANINGVSPGTYVVTISKPNFVVQTLTGITINAGGITNIGADLVSTTGTLIANVYSQGLPLAGATIRIDSIPVQVITGNDGIGRLEALPPNIYYVSAQAPGKVTVSNSISISANQTASLTFDLQQIG